MSAVSKIPENSTPAERLHSLFRGAECRHGTYDQKRLRLVDGKVEMKDENGGGARDVKSPPTVSLWSRHLSGAQPLGVSPAREDGLSRFGVLDIDNYALDHADLAARIQRLELPLILTKSKSGGGHAWLFVDEWVPQADMYSALLSASKLLELGELEIYPPASGPGNWMNMPYLAGDETDRPGIKPGGLEMTLEEFLLRAEQARQPPSRLNQLAERRRPSSPRPAPSEGRPERDLARFAEEISRCASGGRAKLVYGRAKDMGRLVGAGLAEREIVFRVLHEAAVTSGLPYGEASGHINSGLNDGAKEPPDGGGSDDCRYPNIEKIVRIVGGEEPLWRLTIAGWGELTLPVKEVTHYYTFNLRCAEQLGTMFRQLKADQWSDKISQALQSAETEEIPRDETVVGMFYEQTYNFCRDRHRGNEIDDVLLGKPVVVDEEDRIYFRFEAFEQYLRLGSSRFKNDTRHRLGALLRQVFGAENVGKTTKSIKGRVINLRWMKDSALDNSVSISIPTIERPPI